MINRLAEKEAILERLVLEVRFTYGYAYLDKCGRFINNLYHKNPEWTVNNQPTAQSSSLISLSNGAIFTFSPVNYSLSLSREIGKQNFVKKDFDEFRDQIAILSRNINLEFGLESFTRIGFRILYAFASNSLGEAAAWIDNIGILRVNPSLLGIFKGNTERMGGEIVFKMEDRDLRLKLATIQREIKVDLGQSALSVIPHQLPKHQREALIEKNKALNRMAKNPEFAATIDIDVFRENPTEIDVEHFIDSSDKLISESLPMVVKKEKTK